MLTTPYIQTTRYIDDLEMDFVAALEQQIHRNTGDSNVEIPNDAMAENNLPITGDATFNPKEMRKYDSKKRWKNWGWKYSPGKTSSIEEEPTESASTKTSRHSSPTSSPKHKKSTASGGAVVVDSATVTNNNVVSNLLNQSPLRRRPQSAQQSQTTARSNGKAVTVNASNNANRIDIRSSAGARLCQTLDSFEDDENDEFQALIINGRPASVHIVPISSSQNLSMN